MLKLKTGLNIAKRRSGKTTKLLEILHHYPNTIWMAPNNRQIAWVKEKYISLFGGVEYKERNIESRIKIYTPDPNRFRGINLDRIIYLYDEYFYFKTPPELRRQDIAVGTPPYPITMGDTTIADEYEEPEPEVGIFVNGVKIGLVTSFTLKRDKVCTTLHLERKLIEPKDIIVFNPDDIITIKYGYNVIKLALESVSNTINSNTHNRSGCLQI